MNGLKGIPHFGMWFGFLAGKRRASGNGLVGGELPSAGTQPRVVWECVSLVGLCVLSKRAQRESAIRVMSPWWY